MVDLGLTATGSVVYCSDRGRSRHSPDYQTSARSSRRANSLLGRGSGAPSRASVVSGCPGATTPGSCLHGLPGGAGNAPCGLGWQREPNVIIRDAVAGDLAYVRKTWMGEMARTPVVNLMGSAYGRMVTQLLRCSDVRIASRETDQSTIGGFLVGCRRLRLVHFIHARLDVRGMGTARELLADFGLSDHAMIYSTRTTDSQRITSRWGDGRSRYDIGQALWPPTR